MKVERYEKLLHGEMIESWLKEHGAKSESSFSSSFPEIGFVASKDNVYAAASFMRQMEGPYCLFEGLVSNPKLNSFTRHLGIESVVKRLIKEARGRNIKMIFGYSLDAGTLKRSESHGFRLTPHRFIALNLEEHHKGDI